MLRKIGEDALPFCKSCCTPHLYKNDVEYKTSHARVFAK